MSLLIDLRFSALLEVLLPLKIIKARRTAYLISERVVHLNGREVRIADKDRERQILKEIRYFGTSHAVMGLIFRYGNYTDGFTRGIEDRRLSGSKMAHAPRSILEFFEENDHILVYGLKVLLRDHVLAVLLGSLNIPDKARSALPYLFSRLTGSFFHAPVDDNIMIINILYADKRRIGIYYDSEHLSVEPGIIGTPEVSDQALESHPSCLFALNPWPYIVDSVESVLHILCLADIHDRHFFDLIECLCIIRDDKGIPLLIGLPEYELRIPVSLSDRAGVASEDLGISRVFDVDLYIYLHWLHPRIKVKSIEIL